MNLKHLFAAAICAVLTVGAFAADKLAIAEPVGRGGVPAADIEAFWGILESSVQSDEYTLISRGALKQMMTEIGLTTSSDLVNLNSNQKARLEMSVYSSDCTDDSRMPQKASMSAAGTPPLPTGSAMASLSAAYAPTVRTAQIAAAKRCFKFISGILSGYFSSFVEIVWSAFTSRSSVLVL